MTEWETAKSLSCDRQTVVSRVETKNNPKKVYQIRTRTADGDMSGIGG